MLSILLFNLGFFEVVFFIILIYYGLKVIVRFIAPSLVQKSVEKLFKEMKDKDGQKEKRTIRKGDITIKYSDKRPKKYGRADGDYIEYEEIKDKK